MGPQGETGPKGDPGPQGENAKWYVFETLPQSGNFRTGDMCLLANGDVYMYDADLGWNNASHVNIKGPQGSPGINGETPHIGSNNNWWIDNQDTVQKVKMVLMEYLEQLFLFKANYLHPTYYHQILQQLLVIMVI